MFGCYHDINKYKPDSRYKSVYSPAKEKKQKERLL